MLKAELIEENKKMKKKLEKQRQWMIKARDVINTWHNRYISKDLLDRYEKLMKGW